MLFAADGWYEWKKSPDDPKKKQPYFIHAGGPIFFAAISRFHIQEAEQHDDGFVIVTAAREWLSPDTSSVRAEELATRGAT
ncbi:putative SOS response-associated peptidase YedK [compost metagenome]